MANGKAKIGKRTVDGVPKPVEGETKLWDTEIKGFFLRVYATGRRVYALKYRMGSHQRIFTIGTHGSPWTPESARDAAREALERVQAGEDPAVAKKTSRAAMTVANLIDAYLEDGPATKPAKRASTWLHDRSNLDRHIKPLLGRKIANLVTKAEAAKAIRDIVEGKTAKDEKSGKKRGRAIITGGEGAARRTRTTAAAMFAWGIEHGHVANNPFSGVKLASAPVRERFLSRDEAAKFLAALTELESEGDVSRTFGDALRLLLLTGARKTEILALRWSEVDIGRKVILLPPARTKAGGKTGERRVTLSPTALDVLTARRPKDAPTDAYVFPSSRGEGPIIGVRRVFARVCQRANLEHVRVHDLRHSFASFLIADGVGLFIVSKLLGHASSRTTERYAHLGGDPLQDAAALVGRKLMPPADNDSNEQIKTADIVAFPARI